MTRNLIAFAVGAVVLCRVPEWAQAQRSPNEYFHMLAIAGSLTLAEQQSALGPVRIESSGGGGNPIVISMVGVEQDPTPVTARWNPADACLADIRCFVSSWIDANTSGDLQKLLRLRPPDERAGFQARAAETRNLLALNADRFKATRSFGLLGWVEFGAFRIVLLVKSDEQKTNATYTLPLRRVDGRWAQTDALAAENVYVILDRIAQAVLLRHSKNNPPPR